jgi:hypothetical protein
MAVAKWDTPSAQGSNIASTTLNSLASGGTSAFITYDNSSNLDLYASVAITLGSITPTSGANIILRIFSAQSATVPDNTGSIGGGDSYSQMLTTGAGVKVVVFPMVRLYPESLRFAISNNTGVAFASSGNSLTVRPFNENVT